MRIFFTTSVLFFFCSALIAQVSNLGINYQAQIRNSSGVLIPDSTMTIRFQLLPSQFATQPVWQEEHNVTTDKYGIASVVIGKGLKTGGTVATFNLVDFSADNIWIKIELKSGTGFITLSDAEPFQAVPYAKVAGNAVPFPPGFIMPFAGDTTKIPQGWILCDGRELSRSQFASLYNIIGDNWGRGNGSTTFNLPDLRGQFLRGVSLNSGVDPDTSATQRTAKFTGGNVGNRVGSYQSNQVQSHSHTTGQYWDTNNFDAASGTGGGKRMIYAGSGTGATGGNETRPKNVYVHYLIKH